jgi:glycosyltransferase involved in cell wall biosynthesis
MENIMQQHPIISIIMPCYNAGDNIKYSIASVYEQSFKNFELIVVNDGSSDNSLDILTNLAETYPTLRVINQPNKGAGPARNTGLQVARGEFIAFLDADDSWHPDCLLKLHQALQEIPDVAIAYCGWQNLGLTANKCKPYIPPDYENSNKIETFLRECPWPIHAALTRKSEIEAVKGFNECLTSCMDYDLWLKIASFHKIVLVPEVLVYYHHHEGEQITKNHLRLALNQLKVQNAFLSGNPDIAKQLGSEKIAEITNGGLLQRAYNSYWQRDLRTAHALFRKALLGHYFSLKDLKYLLPALLPLAFYQALIFKFSRP